MSFGEQFITLSAEISDTRRGVYSHARIRTIQHPIEDIRHLTARLLTYCHAYSDSLQFSRGLFDPKNPTLFAVNSIGEITTWIDVGLDDAKKLDRAIKAHRSIEHSVYFTQKLQIDRFCHYMKGSKTNWVKPVSFYLWDEQFLLDIGSSLPVRPTWQISIVDYSLYLDDGTREHATTLEPLDIWSLYQESLENSQ